MHKCFKLKAVVECRKVKRRSWRMTRIIIINRIIWNEEEKKRKDHNQFAKYKM